MHPRYQVTDNGLREGYFLYVSSLTICSPMIFLPSVPFQFVSGISKGYTISINMATIMTPADPSPNVNPAAKITAAAMITSSKKSAGAQHETS